MEADLANNTQDALECFLVSTTVCCPDSRVALHWIRSQVRKIEAREITEVRYVPTDQNSEDLAGRGREVTSDLWWNWPNWLRNCDAWPTNRVTEPSPESTVEAMIIREALALTTVQNEAEEVDELLDRHDLRTTLQIGA